MTERKPSATIEWRQRTILVYLDDRLTGRAFEIVEAISRASEDADTQDQLKRVVERVAVAHQLQLVTFAANGGHYDPLETLVTIGLRPAAPPRPPHANAG